MIMAIAAFVGYILTLIGKFPRKYAKPFLVIVLTVILGPGLIVNGILKPFWGRPRPADTVMFGGKELYRGVFEPAGPGGGKSFVCGHCANAFAIASGAVILPILSRIGRTFPRRRTCNGDAGQFRQDRARAHYLSDTVWAGIIVLSIIAWLYFCLFKVPVEPDLSNTETILESLRGNSRITNDFEK